jgi:hypothetical protein
LSRIVVQISRGARCLPELPDYRAVHGVCDEAYCVAWTGWPPLLSPSLVNNKAHAPARRRLSQIRMILRLPYEVKRAVSVVPRPSSTAAAHPHVLPLNAANRHHQTAYPTCSYTHIHIHNHRWPGQASDVLCAGQQSKAVRVV